MYKLNTGRIVLTENEKTHKRREINKSPKLTKTSSQEKGENDGLR